MLAALTVRNPFTVIFRSRGCNAGCILMSCWNTGWGFGVERALARAEFLKVLWGEQSEILK